MKRLSLLLITTTLLFIIGLTAAYADQYYEYFRLIHIDDNGTLKTEGKYDHDLGQFLYTRQISNCYRALYNESNEMIAFFSGPRRYSINYTSHGKVEELTEINQQLRIFYTLRFEYNNHGDIEKRTKFRRLRFEGSDRLDKVEHVENTFNNKDQLIRSVYKNQENEEFKTISYTYNDNGDYHQRITQVTNDDGTTSTLKETFIYDRSQRITSHKKYENNVLKSEVQYFYANNGWTLEKEETYIFNMEYLAHTNTGGEELRIQEYPDGQLISSAHYGSDQQIVSVYESRPYFYGYLLYNYYINESLENSEIFATYKYINLDGEPDPNYVQANFYPSSQRKSFHWRGPQGQDLLEDIPEAFLSTIRIHNLLACKYILVGKIVAENYAENTLIVEILGNEGRKNWCTIYGDFFYYFATPEDPLIDEYNQVRILKPQREDKIIPIDTNQPVIWLGEISLDDYNPFTPSRSIPSGN